MFLYILSWQGEEDGRELACPPSSGRSTGSGVCYIESTLRKMKSESWVLWNLISVEIATWALRFTFH